MISINEFTNEDKLPFEKIDLFIAASGYEERSIYQAEKFLSIIERGIVLGFKNQKERLNRIKNDNFFSDNGFEFINSDVDNVNNLSLGRILQSVDTIFESKQKINVYIDYSSMSKNLYSYLLYGIYNQERNFNLCLYLGYSHAKYTEDTEIKTLNKVVTPLHGYCNLSLPTKPTSLVIGLGNELNRVFGLKEYFDAIPYIFHTDDSYNKSYYDDAKKLLGQISSQIPPENIFEYPIKDLRYSYYMLKNLCDELIKQTRVIIAPCGPKPFAILAMLLSLEYEDDIEVWRISPGSNLTTTNRVPTGLISILEVKFQT